MSEFTDDQPLSNVRVLDLSRVLAGPWATQLLATTLAGTAALANLVVIRS